jgi:hypothetical protein
VTKVVVLQVRECKVPAEGHVCAVNGGAMIKEEDIGYARVRQDNWREEKEKSELTKWDRHHSKWIAG